MDFNEMTNALKEAQRNIDIADRFTGDVARMVAGRLRKSNASVETLRTLKKELAGFNMHTCSWKD